MTESQIEEQILQWLTVNGWFCWKNPTTGYHDGKSWRRQSSPFAFNGVSDIIAVKDSRVIFIEVKTPNGAQSDTQKKFEEKLTKFGGKYLLARSVDDLISL